MRLRAPAYLPLRNPYLLQRYLEAHGAQIGAVGQTPAPVDVDALIDDRIMQVIQRVARTIGCAPSDVTPAMHGLAGRLWDRRPQGLAYRETIDTLNQHLPHDGSVVLTTLREAGILTAEGLVRLIEPRLRDHLFALHLITIFGSVLEGALAHLEPGEDAGVVQTLLRHPAVDAVAIAERLLSQDARWRAVVADGLSTSSPENDQVLALLVALTRPQEGRLVADIDACHALGRIAARGRRAWAWAAQLYLSYDNLDRVRGEHALTAAMDVAPERVAAVMRLRLAYAMRQRRGSRVRERWLRGLLTPMQGISHRSMAGPVRRLLQRYSDVFTSTPQLASEFADDLDTARGILAVHNSHEGEVDVLIEELQAPDAVTRYRAVRALRPVIFERPERVADALYNAIRSETDQRVLCRLLWVSYPLRVTTPGPLFDALEASIAFHWGEAPQVTSLALLVLGHLAHYDVARVARYLPPQLPGHDPARRAATTEILAYAWWVYAEYDGSASQHLQALAATDVNDSPAPFRIFAWRGKALAQLALLCIGRISVRGLIGLQFPYRGSDLEFLHVDTSDFVRDHAAQVLQHPSSSALFDMLFRALQSHNAAPEMPGDVPDIGNVHRCRMLCIDMLVALLVALPDIDSAVVRRVLATAQSFYILGRLLEEGRRDQTVLQAARELSIQPRNEISSGELEDLTFCAAQLVALSEDSEADLGLYLAHMGRSSFWRLEQAAILAATLDAHRTRALPLLNSTVRSPDDLPYLFYWSHHAHTWQNTLLSGVYRRLFDARQIGQREAIALCQRMLTGIRALPPSEEQHHYEQTYACLLDALEGRPIQPGITSEPPTAGPLQQSLRYAVSLLQALYGQRGLDMAALYPHIVDHRGYWEVEGYEYADGKFSFGSGQLGYLLPHVRLALVAIGQRCGLSDPGGLILAERQHTALRFKLYRGGLTQEPQRFPMEYVESVLAQFTDQARQTPHDERIPGWLGLILLHLGRLEAAEQALTQHLSFPYLGDDRRGKALYNLACVYARQGRVEQCRAALEESARHRALDRAWLWEDPDLESVRALPWFTQLASTP